jgi:hypothetical protein
MRAVILGSISGSIHPAILDIGAVRPECIHDNFTHERRLILNSSDDEFQ